MLTEYSLGYGIKLRSGSLNLDREYTEKLDNF